MLPTKPTTIERVAMSEHTILPMAAVTIDDVMVKIGEFRHYQFYLCCIIGYGLLTLFAFPYMIVSFITAEPDWKCVEGYMNNTVCRFNTSITLTSDDYKARCIMPREAWTFVDDFTSVVTEYDLVCDHSIFLSIAQSCSWVGTLVGLLVGGYLSDTFGRKIIVSFGCVVIILATWIVVFPKSFATFISCRVFIGLGTGFANVNAYALLLEFFTKKYRARVGIGILMCWVIGVMILPLIGYFVPSWRTFLLITAACGIPGLFFYWLLLESPRWLLLHNKEEEAKAVLAKVAKMNKRSLPDNLMLQKPVEPETRSSFRQLFCGWKISKITLISWNLWFANALVYYGVSFGSVDLGGNKYLNFFLITLVELPSNFAAIWTTDRFGRKLSVIVGMLVAFTAVAISVAIPTNQTSASVGGHVAVAIIAKFFINASYGSVYLWSAELFPTVIRSTGMATSSAMARIGAFLASYIVWLIRIHAALPYGIMGVICLQSAICGLFLPETRGVSTLETMSDMKKQKNDQPVDKTEEDG